MPLIPSESQSFADHFRQMIADMRNPREKKFAPLVQQEAPPSPREKGFFLLIREFLSWVAKPAPPQPAAEAPPNEEGFTQLEITLQPARQAGVPAADATPHASEQA